jgi:hypothetical protein
MERSDQISAASTAGPGRHIAPVGPVRQNQNGVAARQRRNGAGKDIRVQCTGEPGGVRCTTQIRPNSTKLCRSCWLNPEVRPRKRFARSEPAQQIAQAMHLLLIGANGTKTEDPGSGLALLAQAHTAVGDAMLETVRALRAMSPPVTWDEIAASLGTTRDVAWKRYARHCEPLSQVS